MIDFLREPQKSVIRIGVDVRTREIVKRALCDANDVITDKSGTFASAVFGVFQAAFPFENSPAGEVVLANLEKMALKSTCPSPNDRNRPARSTHDW